MERRCCAPHKIFSMPTPTNLLALLKVFPATRALVVGDAVLDDYWHGRAARLSREAPIPVLEWEGQQSIPGGACNPAANIAAVGGRVIQEGDPSWNHRGGCRGRAASGASQRTGNYS